MKIRSVTCVIGWLAFWAFGALALTSRGAPATATITATTLAFLGLLSGTTSRVAIAQEVR